MWNLRSRYRAELAAYGAILAVPAPICVGRPHAARATKAALSTLSAIGTIFEFVTHSTVGEVRRGEASEPGMFSLGLTLDNG